MLPQLEVADWILDCALAADGTLIVGCAHNAVELYDLVGTAWKLRCHQEPAEKCMLYCMALLPSESLVACGTIFSEVLVWEFGGSEPKLRNRLKGHKGVIFKMLWISPELLASGSDDRSVRLWRVGKDGGEELACLFGHAARIWDMAFMREYNMLVSVGEDASCILWDLEKRKMVHKVKGVTGKDLWRVSYLNGIIATGGNDSTIQLFLADRLLIQNKSLFQSPAELAAESGSGHKSLLYSRWDLPQPHSATAKDHDFAKSIDITWEVDPADPSRITRNLVVLCTSKTKVYAVDAHTFSSELVYAHDTADGASCVKGVPPIVCAALGPPLSVLIVSLTRGNMAVIGCGNSKSHLRPLYWKAGDTHINTIHLLSHIGTDHPYLEVMDPTNLLNFATCSAEGELKEWTLGVGKKEGDMVSLEAKLVGEHRTHNGYEIISLARYQDNYLVGGDTYGTLHVFLRNDKSPAAVHYKRFHQYERVACIKTYKDRLYSVGRDGRLNRYAIAGGHALQLIETMNIVDFPLINDVIFGDDEGREDILLFGCTETYGFVWNYTEGYPLFTFDCKGGNRPLAFLKEFGTKGNFLFAYSSKDQVMIFNLLSSQVATQPVFPGFARSLARPFLNTSFHSREILCMAAKQSDPTTGRTLLVTGGEDTKIKISRLFPAGQPLGVKCVKTITVHRSCAKAVRLVRTPVQGFYYLITGGGRTEFHIFEVHDEDLVGLHFCYLSSILLRGEDDARIMCIDTVLVGKKWGARGEAAIYILAGTSAGEAILMEYVIDENRINIKARIPLGAAVLSCKLIMTAAQNFAALVATTEGEVYGYSFFESMEKPAAGVSQGAAVTNATCLEAVSRKAAAAAEADEDEKMEPKKEEEKGRKIGKNTKQIRALKKKEKNKKGTDEIRLATDATVTSTQTFKTKVHQCNTNALSLKRLSSTKYVVLSGSDDQSLALSIWDLAARTFVVKHLETEAHSSSIRVARLIRNGDRLVALASGYDQRLSVWNVNLNVKEDGARLDKAGECVHGVPDVNAMNKIEHNGRRMIALAGCGVEVIALNL